MKKITFFLMTLIVALAPMAMNAQEGLRPIKGLAPMERPELKDIQPSTPSNENASRATLIINNGTETCSYMPIWGQAVGNTVFSQFIIPAESMATMAPEGYLANITALRFYASSQNVSWGSDVQFIVFLKEVEETEFSSSYYSWNELINNGDYYYFGSLSVSRGAMVITLDDTFQYYGGNLLIGFYEYTTGSAASVSWYGNSTDATNTVLGYGSNAYGYGFLPKIQFTYSQEESSCVVPANLDLFGITQTMAGLNWTERGQSTEWELSYSTTEGDPDNGTIVPVSDEPNTILTELTEGTIYYAYVRSICDGDTPTDWSAGIAFRTPATCDVPSNVEVSNITQTTADVEWWGYDESYDVRYRQQSGHDIANFINNQAGADATVTGDFADYTFSLSGYSGNGYIAIRHYNVSDMFWLDVATVTVKDRRGNVVFEGDLTDGIPEGWYAIDYDGDGYNWKENTGFVYSESYSSGALDPDNWLITPQVPLGGSVVVNAKGQDPDYADEVFGVFVSTTTVVEYPWTTVEDVEGESDAITGLTPETTYEVQVRAHSCPGDWSDAITFTTLSGCDVPVGLNTTDITAVSATLNWVEALDEYNIRYRSGFVYDFESASPWAVDNFAPCTTYDGDGSETGGISGVSFTNQGYTGSFIAFQNGTAAVNAVAHGGNAFGACFYASPAPNDDWFILPEITIENGDVFTFWARSFSSNYLETFKVGIYGGNGTMSDYLEGSASASTTVPAAWTEYSYDLSTYVGQTIQLAINCDSDDKFAFFIDDIFVGNPSWSTPVSVAGGSYILEGLDMQTTYQWQVQGVDCDGNETDTEWNTASFTTLEGYIKHIDAYSGDGGYYLIASPIGQVSPEDVTNMLENEYDLYYFNENPTVDPETGIGFEWINYEGQNGGFDLQPGKGYLYANSGSNNEGIDLIFSGSANTDVTEVTLALTTGAEFEGLNLVGNPFADSAYIDRSFYKMATGGAAIATTAFSGAIEPMEGVFVYANSDGEAMTFSTTNPNAKIANLTLNLTQGNSLVDRAIVCFSETSLLPKFQLKKSSTKVYIPMDNKDYAVVYTEEQGVMPVNFKAENDGTYTLNINTEEVSFGYLHLIDNMTGNDVDLLANPSYSFEAKTTDYESRFKLVFATGNADDNFAFYSNGSFVINNEGNATLQVIDINGRILKSESISGCSSIDMNAAQGIYMLRLVNGDNVKVQKVVVR